MKKLFWNEGFNTGSAFFNLTNGTLNAGHFLLCKKCFTAVYVSFVSWIKFVHQLVQILKSVQKICIGLATLLHLRARYWLFFYLLDSWYYCNSHSHLRFHASFHLLWAAGNEANKYVKKLYNKNMLLVWISEPIWLRLAEFTARSTSVKASDKPVWTFSILNKACVEIRTRFYLSQKSSVNLFGGTGLLGGTLLNGDVWVQLQHSLDVLERVLLDGDALAAGAAWSEGSLDFIGLEMIW